MKATQIKAQELKLQEGKRYRRRDGQVTGQIKTVPSTCDPNRTVFHLDPETGCLYWDHGSYQVDVDSDEDLLQELDLVTINEQGDELPNATYFVTSPKDMASMQATIDLQAEKIKKLQAVIDRKNRIMTAILEDVRHELDKDGQ